MVRFKTVPSREMVARKKAAGRRMREKLRAAANRVSVRRKSQRTMSSGSRSGKNVIKEGPILIDDDSDFEGFVPTFAPTSTPAKKSDKRQSSSRYTDEESSSSDDETVLVHECSSGKEEDDEDEVIGNRPLNSPFFVALYRPGPRCKLFVPDKVIKENNLVLAKNMVYQSPDDSEWPVEVSMWRDGRTFIGGWALFCKKNNVRQGDKCICEFVLDKGRHQCSGFRCSHECGRIKVQIIRGRAT